MRDATQVLVAGGGPAGSVAAGLLARSGAQVTLLESATFPRYHIGESILPSCLPVLDLLGAREKVERHGFVRKGGAWFEWGPENWELDFDHIRGTERHSFQVVRSEFDQLLLEHAREQGVEVVEGTSVRQVEFDGDRAVAATWARGDRTGRIAFDQLVDATGRAGVLATRHLRNRTYNEAFRNVALWGYWRGAKPLDRGPEGAIAVCSVPDGWFWGIPLHDGTYSVGLVTSKKRFAERRDAAGGDLRKMYADAIAECARIGDLVAPAELVSELKIEQDYSYACDRFAGPGWMMAGDSACFLDPLLSTGVHLATFSALLAAASIGSVARGEIDEAEAARFYDRAYRQSYERLLVLVSLLYGSYQREAHLFQAEKLTRRERRMLELYESFLQVVSGVEDLADARESGLDAIAARLASGADVGGHNQAMDSMPDSERSAVGGLYLAYEPRLGLRRVSGAPAPTP